MILKYIPGMHLRVSDEAEENGLDMDQFFEEEIGDWEIMDRFQSRYNRTETVVGQALSDSTDQVAVETKTA